MIRESTLLKRTAQASDLKQHHGIHAREVIVEQYTAEASRTFFVGEPSGREQTIWKTCMKTYPEIEARVQPGVTMHELDVLYKKLWVMDLRLCLNMLHPVDWDMG